MMQGEIIYSEDTHMPHLPHTVVIRFIQRMELQYRIAVLFLYFRHLSKPKPKPSDFIVEP